MAGVMCLVRRARDQSNPGSSVPGDRFRDLVQSGQALRQVEGHQVHVGQQVGVQPGRGADRLRRRLRVRRHGPFRTEAIAVAGHRSRGHRGRHGG